MSQCARETALCTKVYRRQQLLIDLHKNGGSEGFLYSGVDSKKSADACQQLSAVGPFDYLSAYLAKLKLPERFSEKIGLPVM